MILPGMIEIGRILVETARMSDVLLSTAQPARRRGHGAARMVRGAEAHPRGELAVRPTDILTGESRRRDVAGGQDGPGARLAGNTPALASGEVSRSDDGLGWGAGGTGVNSKSCDPRTAEPVTPAADPAAPALGEAPPRLQSPGPGRPLPAWAGVRSGGVWRQRYRWPR